MNLLITTLLILVSVTDGRSSLRGADDNSSRRSLVTLTSLNNTWQATELAYTPGTSAQPIDTTYPITLNFNSSRMSGLCRLLMDGVASEEQMITQVEDL